MMHIMLDDHKAIRSRGNSKMGNKDLGMPANPSPRSDDEIAQRAARCLQWSLRVPEDSVDIRVENGWVTLTGAVQWRYQRLAAEAAVRDLDGVRGLTNHIRLRPHADDEDVRQKMIDVAWTWQRGHA